MKRVVVLASGSGSIAQSIFDAVDAGRLQVTIVAVISDQDSLVLRRADQHGIAKYLVPMKSPRMLWDQELFALAEKLNPDLVVSVGFMRILSADFVRRFKVINTHPALLPNFPGAHAVRDALRAGATETGTTVHWVDEGMDTGPVIAQVPVAILPEDDEATLHERIKIVERELIVTTLNNLISSGAI